MYDERKNKKKTHKQDTGPHIAFLGVRQDNIRYINIILH